MDVIQPVRNSFDKIWRFIRWVFIGNLGEHGPGNRLTTAPDGHHHHHTNILGPKHFIVEEENEALLAKELQEAKIQSTHNSLSSMHGSQSHFNFETNDFTLRNPNVCSIESFDLVESLFCLVTSRSIGITFQIFIIVIRCEFISRKEITEESLGYDEITFYNR